MKHKLLVLVLAASLSAHADWVEDSVSYDVSSKDGMEMAEALGNFPAALSWLNAHSLTGNSRLKVTQIIGRVAMYRWENDANCTVTDPGSVNTVSLYHSTTDYIYEANPTVVLQLMTSTGQEDPCVNPKPAKPLAKNVTSKR